MKKFNGEGIEIFGSFESIVESSWDPIKVKCVKILDVEVISEEKMIVNYTMTHPEYSYTMLGKIWISISKGKCTLLFSIFEKEKEGGLESREQSTCATI